MNSVDLNRLLFLAISNVMTEEQIDLHVPAIGMTTRDLLKKSAIYMAGVIRAVEQIDARGAAKASRIKAYWHPHGLICATKPNGEWQPLVLEFE